jgi:hypothetical protein
MDMSAAKKMLLVGRSAFNSTMQRFRKKNVKPKQRMMPAYLK